MSTADTVGGQGFLPTSTDTDSLGVAGTSIIVCRPAQSAEALKEHRSIRHEVFVLEQALFVETDVDVHDHHESTICLVGYCDGVAAGSVRLFEVDRSTGLWQGDRLAVLRRFRAIGLGAPLVRCAVATAGALGGTEMMAHIQLPNVRFFSRLGWTSVGETELYVGRPHQQMRIALPCPERGAALVQAFARGSSRGREAVD